MMISSVGGLVFRGVLAFISHEVEEGHIESKAFHAMENRVLFFSYSFCFSYPAVSVWKFELKYLENSILYWNLDWWELHIEVFGQHIHLEIAFWSCDKLWESHDWLNFWKERCLWFIFDWVFFSILFSLGFWVLFPRKVWI